MLLDLGTDLTPLPAVCMELGKEIKLCLKNVHGKEGSFGRGAGIYGVIFYKEEEGENLRLTARNLLHSDTC